MIKGLDHLAFAHPAYPRNLVAATLPEGWALGVFDDPFGPVLKYLHQFLRKRFVPIVRIHAHWSDTHQIIKLSDLERKSSQYQSIAMDFPRTQFFISHSCEYRDTSHRHIEARIKILQRLAPSCRIVQSIAPGSVYAHHDRIEMHGNIQVPDGGFASMDGTNHTKMNVRQWLQKNRNAEVCFLWRDQFNMREPGRKPPPPKLRRRIPVTSEIEELISLS